MKLVACVLAACVLTAGTLLCSVAAVAEDIDLSAWTCKKFLAANKDDVGIILSWLDGYYKEEDAPPVIDIEQFVANAKKLGEYCAAHPDDYLIDVTDKLFQKG
jgi:acid stress chaperone HdeB